MDSMPYNSFSQKKMIDLNHKHSVFWDSRYMYKFVRLAKENNH